MKPNGDEQTTPHPRLEDAEPFIGHLSHQPGAHLPLPLNDSTWLMSLLGDWQQNPQKQAASWIAACTRWRDEHRVRIAYRGDDYDRPELSWAERNFVQALVLVEDRYFYDPVVRCYTIDRYLDDLVERYGGVDSVLIWPSYPNIGIDARNQIDWIHDLPGGIDGLKGVVADFHRRGVRVFLPILPWDNGSRPLAAHHWDALVSVACEVGADGLHGDTYTSIPQAFRDAAQTHGAALVLQPQISTSIDEVLSQNTQSWGKASPGRIPAVNTLKWLEPRHMINLENRWARDRSHDLQHAFFNGIGYVSWENVWGIWNGFTERDGAALRRIATIYRSFPTYFVSPEWAPYAATLQSGIFASLFPGRLAQAVNTIWTLVNRNEFAVAGEQLKVFHRAGTRYWNLWQATELTPRVEGPVAILSLGMEARGYGCVMATMGEPSPELRRFLNSAGPAPTLTSLSARWDFLGQTAVEVTATGAPSKTPRGMISIPAGTFCFAVSGVEIEGDRSVGLDVQYAWEDAPRREHRHTMQIRPFLIDRCLVTNGEFKTFIDQSGYVPADGHNFLRHWVDGAPAAGCENRPVVWIALEDAHAYAAWCGKRLPREWEWQYAAQGHDGRIYPWGNQWDAARVPATSTATGLAPPPEVGLYPTGASPFGVLDLVGHVWQWTDEYQDLHTRSAIVRGGSYFRPVGSHWYFPSVRRLDQHGKLLLMSPGRDRSAMVGLRCVVDDDGPNTR